MSSFTYRTTYNTKQTAQSQPIPGTDQVENSAGGYSWAVSDWTRLDRFLVLGCESPSYYASQQKLSRDNAEAVLRCIKEDGLRTVARTVEISDAGRAPKNSPAIFALALAASYGDETTKKAAFKALAKVCRIGTHIFEFCEYIQGMRGWGRGLRNAVGKWYLEEDSGSLAYQMLKYQNRNGWSHRDLLRLSHPKPPQDETYKALFHWATKGWETVGAEPHPDESLRQIWAMERLKNISAPSEARKLISEYRLPREAVPSELLKSPLTWLALLPDMPATALLRNLGTLSKLGLFADAETEQSVADRFSNAAWLKKARVHPIAILMALRTYSSGHGVRSQASWPVSQKIVDALDAAFYAAFKSIEPTGKRYLLALDVSGSMGGGEVGGVPGLTPRDASAALALVTASTEPNCEIVGFTSGRRCGGWFGRDSGNAISRLNIRPGQKLNDAIAVVSGLDFGGTDCALPMLHALKNNQTYDCFVVFTDSETWCNPQIHPAQALRQYRGHTGINAKLIVVGLVSNGFSIADPDDGGMLDVVGFDTVVPQIMADFAKE